MIAEAHKRWWKLLLQISSDVTNVNDEIFLLLESKHDYYDMKDFQYTKLKKSPKELSWYFLFILFYFFG